MDERATHAIPDIEASPYSYLLPGLRENVAAHADLGPDARQLHKQIDDMNRVDNRVDHFAPEQIQRIPHNANSDREDFLIALREKHSNMSSNYHAPASRQRKHYNPKPREAERPYDPILGRFESLVPGDQMGDRLRRQVRGYQFQDYDGRLNDEEVVVDTGARGMFDTAQQSAYEAMHSRPTKFIKRELEALKAVRSNYEREGRSMAVNWQGPAAIHRIGSSGAIPRRRVENTEYSAADGTSTYFIPYQKPETIMSLVQDTRIAPGRHDVTGSIWKVERPQVDSIVHSKKRPTFTEMRAPNAIGSTYVGSSLVFGSRADQLTNTVNPDYINVAQRPIMQVAGNRAMRQFNTEKDFDENREESHSNHHERHAGKWGIEKQYQENGEVTGILNKVVVQDRNPQLLRGWNPFERNQDMYRL